MSVETLLHKLCEDNDLTTISVMHQTRWGGVTVYPHWEENGEDRCVSSTAKTFDEAFANAMHQVDLHRADQTTTINAFEQCTAAELAARKALGTE